MEVRDITGRESRRRSGISRGVRVGGGHFHVLKSLGMFQLSSDGQ